MSIAVPRVLVDRAVGANAGGTRADDEDEGWCGLPGSVGLTVLAADGRAMVGACCARAWLASPAAEAWR